MKVARISVFSLVTGLLCSLSICDAQAAFWDKPASQSASSQTEATAPETPEMKAAGERVDQTKSKLDQSRKQLDAAKASLKAADAEYRAAKADKEALVLRGQANQLVGVAQTVNTSVSPDPRATHGVAPTNSGTGDTPPGGTAPQPANNFFQQTNEAPQAHGQDIPIDAAGQN